MILKLLIVCLVLLAAWYVFITSRSKKIISFKETYDLTGLPIVTFIHKGHKVNFLLDTGSSLSFINRSVAIDLNLEVKESTVSYNGVDGKESFVDGQTVFEFEYKDDIYFYVFMVSDFSEAFESVRAETGVRIDGLLGASFFAKYKYILDFKEFKAIK